MKNLSIILPVLFSFMSFNQHNKKVKTILNDFNNFCEVTKADSISANDIIDGIAMSNGFGGTIFQFDLNFTYKKISYDCVSRLIIDSGKWSIKNNKILVLNSNDQTLSFNILKFDKFYFFILPSQFPKFIEDLKILRAKFKSSKPITIENQTYKVNYFIGSYLREKYYTKEINDIAVTNNVYKQ